jgi:hypothetical protein
MIVSPDGLNEVLINLNELPRIAGSDILINVTGLEFVRPPDLSE